MNPASPWRVLDEPLLARRVLPLIEHARKPVPAADAVACGARLSPSASTAGAASRRSRLTRTLRHRRTGGSLPRSRRSRRVDALGRPAEHLRRATRTATRGRRGTTSASSTASRRCGRAHHAGGVPRPEREGRQLETAGGHGAGGLPVHVPRLRRPAHSTRGARATCNLARTAASPPRRAEGDVEAMNAAYNSGPGVRRRDRHPDHRLAPLPRRRAQHAQLPPVVRRRAQRMLDRTATRPTRSSGSPTRGRRALRPDADGARGDGPVDGQHPRPSRARASRATSRPSRSTAASPPTATLIAARAEVWNGILDGGRTGACTQWFPSTATSRTVAGGPFGVSVFTCARQPVRRNRPRDVRPWTPSRPRASG